jgi:uncharacterized protein YecE (DUF72 family)
VPTATPGAGTHLNRYARRLRGVEINSSFYRSHAGATYERWAVSTPLDFRFAVKMPREISHVLQLRGCRAQVERFLDETAGLGHRRGPLLLQLAPSFSYAAGTVGRFLALLRQRHDGPVVVEPRHPSWFSDAADALLTSYRAGRVGADPAIAHGGGVPSAWPGVQYFRLHGTPRMYWSPYSPGALADLAERLRLAAESGAEVWCIFDNTAGGAAFPNAREVRRRVERPATRRR